MTSSRVASSHESMARIPRLLLVMSGLATAVAPGLALAEPLDGSVAQALFNEARELMKLERLSEACPKLAESQRLEPAAGTLLNLALCHELDGKTATAWLEYNDALALAARERNAERQALARERIAALEPTLARLVVIAPVEPPNGLWVKLDELSLSAVTWGTSLPVDPGVHHVRYGAPGREEQRIEITIVPKTEQRVELTSLAVVRAARSREPQAPQPNAPLTVRDGNDFTWPAVGGAGIGLGVAGIAVGAYFGVRAREAWSERNELCAPRCGNEAADAGARAQDFARAANVSVAIALVGLGAGIYALFLRPALTEPVTSTRRRRVLALDGSAAPGRGNILLRVGF